MSARSASRPAPARSHAPPQAPSPAPAGARPQGCTNLKLRQLARRVGRHYDEEVRALGLKGTQYSLLSAVVKLGGPDRPGGPGGATQAALAAALDLDPSTLARNLKPMLDRGWLAVEPGADQRSHRVVATAAGLALRHRAQAGWKRSQLALNARLGEARVARLHALLDECMAALAGEGGAGEGAPREA